MHFCLCSISTLTFVLHFVTRESCMCDTHFICFCFHWFIIDLPWHVPEIKAVWLLNAPSIEFVLWPLLRLLKNTNNSSSAFNCVVRPDPLKVWWLPPLSLQSDHMLDLISLLGDCEGVLAELRKTHHTLSGWLWLNTYKHTQLEGATLTSHTSDFTIHTLINDSSETAS